MTTHPRNDCQNDVQDDVQNYVVPQSIAEAVRILADGPATILAGGTDLMPQGGAGREPTLMNITRVRELRGIEVVEGFIHIGALVTVTDVLESRGLREHAAVLVEAADCFASDQIRNAATVGGNIMNASPAADLVIPLLVLDAEVELASWADGGVERRTTPLRDFFAGPGKTRIAAGEMLEAVRFACPAAGFASGFRKFGTRPALDISVVSVGLGGYREAGGLREIRVAFGATAPTPIRGVETEAAATGVTLTDDKIEAIAHVAAAEVRPITDFRASAAYRRHLVQTFTKRLLARVTRN